MDAKFLVIGLFLAIILVLVGGKEALFGVLHMQSQAANSDTCAGADAHWRSTEAIGTIDAFEDHLVRFGNCPFANLAIKRINSMHKPLEPKPVEKTHNEYLDDCKSEYLGSDSKGENTIKFTCP